MLTSIISDKIDVLLLSETKIDETFPLDQLIIPGLRLDRNSWGGDIILLILNTKPFRLLNTFYVVKYRTRFI